MKSKFKCAFQSEPPINFVKFKVLEYVGIKNPALFLSRLVKNSVFDGNVYYYREISSVPRKVAFFDER